MLFGFAYGPSAGQLKSKELVLAISTGGPAESYHAGSYNNFSMSELLALFQQTALMMGMTYLPPFVLHSAMTRNPGVLTASIPAVVAHVTSSKLDLNAKAAQEIGGLPVQNKPAHSKISLGL